MRKETTKKQEKIYPSINIIFTFISINNKNNNSKWQKIQKEINRNKINNKETKKRKKIKKQIRNKKTRNK